MKSNSTEANQTKPNFGAIYILAGSVKQLVDHSFTVGDFQTFDFHNLILESYSRCLAGFLIWQKNSNSKAIASGAVLPVEYNNPSFKISYSQVYTEALIKLGIDQESILQSQKPTDTLTELMSLIEFTVSHNWQNIAVICNRAQMERTKLLWSLILDYPIDFKITDPNQIVSQKLFANRVIYRKEQLITPEFLQNLVHFKLINLSVTFIKAEDVVEEFDPSQAIIFAEFYQSKPMETRLKTEQNGIRDILNGVYYVPKISLN